MVLLMGSTAWDGTTVNLLAHCCFSLSCFLAPFTLHFFVRLCEQSSMMAQRRIHWDILWKTTSRALVFARIDLANTTKVGIRFPD